MAFTSGHLTSCIPVDIRSQWESVYVVHTEVPRMSRGHWRRNKWVHALGHVMSKYLEYGRPWFPNGMTWEPHCCAVPGSDLGFGEFSVSLRSGLEQWAPTFSEPWTSWGGNIHARGVGHPCAPVSYTHLTLPTKA